VKAKHKWIRVGKDVGEALREVYESLRKEKRPALQKKTHEKANGNPLCFHSGSNTEKERKIEDRNNIKEKLAEWEKTALQGRTTG